MKLLATAILLTTQTMPVPARASAMFVFRKICLSVFRNTTLPVFGQGHSHRVCHVYCEALVTI